jgi:predicted anti-sigma-YlaC factor YlaD
MTHPTPAELLELHFGEAAPARRSRLAAHRRSCAACRALLDDVAWAERLLTELPDEEPPADGLERVLARLAPAPARAPRRAAAWRAALPSAAAIAGGAVAVALGGGTAALAFFAAGSLVTLSLAPALILESQRRGGAAAGR